MTTSAALPEIFSAGSLIINGAAVALPQLPTVRQLVAARPHRARVFEKYGLSYCCCSGNKTFWEACREKAIDPKSVLAELHESDVMPQTGTHEKCGDWSLERRVELRRHIVEVHHAFLRVELPRLSYLIERVTTRHGALYNELWELQSVFEEFKEEVEWHLEREEGHLFPLLERLESSAVSDSTLQTAIGKEICTLELEHEYLCKTLSYLRALANDFQIPETACNTFRVMLHSLSQLVDDMNIHMQEENYLLLFSGLMP